MRHRRMNKRRMGIAGAGVAALVAGTLTMANANAADPVPPADTLTSAAASDLATTLAADLRNDTAGAYYDTGTKQLVVNVVDRSAAEKVEQAGAKAKLVEHTLAQLTSAKSELGESAVPGTSRAVDPVTNKVVVTADSTVKAADLAALKKEVAAQDGRAVLTRTRGEFKPFAAGGDAIFGSGSRCSLGFNVVKDGEPHFLTAGHCGTAGSTWSDSSGGSPIGTMAAGTFPGADHALVKYTSGTDHPSEVNLYNGQAQQISGAREATVGERVQRSGSTTQLHGGSVQALDVSVTYPQGTVNGLIQTDVCAEPGDSGGALFAGSDAIGLTSGGSGDCSSGGQTFFQPVTDALAEYDARIG